MPKRYLGIKSEWRLKFDSAGSSDHQLELDACGISGDSQCYISLYISEWGLILEWRTPLHKDKSKVIRDPIIQIAASKVEL